MTTPQCDARPRTGVLSSRYLPLTIGLLTLVATAALSRLGVSTVVPEAVEELGGLRWYGWVFTAFTLANIIGLAAAGPVFDRFGIVRPLAVGTASFAIGLLIAALAPMMPVIVLGRVFQGLGAGSLSVAAYAAIGRGVPDALRPRMLALNATAFTVPSLVGPLLAGWAAENFTWRWVFAILVPLAPLAALVARGPLGGIEQRAREPVVPRAAAAANRLALRRALGGGLALSIGLGTVSAAPSLPVPGALLALALAAPVGYFGVRQALPSGTFSANRGLPANVLFAAALSMAFFTVDLFIPLALTSARGISATLAGAVLTSGIIGWTAGAYLPDRLLRSGLTTGAIARLGALLVIAGLAVITVVVLTETPILLAAAGWVLAGLGAGMGFTTNSLAVLEDAIGTVGSASSQMELGNQAGIALGTGLAGALVGTLGATAAGLGGVFALAGAGAGLALLASTRFSRPTRP